LWTLLPSSIYHKSLYIQFGYTDLALYIEHVDANSVCRLFLLLIFLPLHHFWKNQYIIFENQLDVQYYFIWNICLYLFSFQSVVLCLCYMRFSTGGLKYFLSLLFVVFFNRVLVLFLSLILGWLLILIISPYIKCQFCSF